jgi:RNA polymerase sigma-70 factor (ECF subfamily)
MPGRGESTHTGPVVYCLVPRDLALKLHEQLRQHFAHDPTVEVIVERRDAERRGQAQRRVGAGAARKGDRRRIRSVPGRRVAERRVSFVAVDPLILPRRARTQAHRLTFVERIEPTAPQAEDEDTARLVTRIQSGDRDAFALLYMRYFDRVYSYLRVVLRDSQAAEDVSQQVFLRVLESIGRYELRPQPFRAWLFAIVRNHAISYLRKHSRLDVVAPADLDRRRDGPDELSATEGDVLDWISDREVLLLVRRLPLAQRQVLMMRYMVGLDTSQIAAILERTPTDVRTLEYRARRFLRQRLASLGRDPRTGARIRMRRWPKTATVLRARRFALTNY